MLKQKQVCLLLAYVQSTFVSRVLVYVCPSGQADLMKQFTCLETQMLFELHRVVS